MRGRFWRREFRPLAPVLGVSRDGSSAALRLAPDSVLSREEHPREWAWSALRAIELTSRLPCGLAHVGQFALRGLNARTKEFRVVLGQRFSYGIAKTD
jgi:hypothetical protein